jgi:phage repressor protein C with HTH and peptisase S24 domain
MLRKFRGLAKAHPADLRTTRVESVNTPTPPGIFVLFDGLGLVAKRLEHVASAEPPLVRIISDNPLYAPYERSAEEITIVGRIRWFAREM